MDIFDHIPTVHRLREQEGFELCFKCGQSFYSSQFSGKSFQTAGPLLAADLIFGSVEKPLSEDLRGGMELSSVSSSEIHRELNHVVL